MDKANLHHFKKFLNTIIFDENYVPRSLQQPVAYILGKGENLRPLLLYDAASTRAITQQSIDSIAVAIELIHTFTLAHDDLPALDNTDFRRNQASLHRRYGVRTAIIVGDLLLNMAYQLISNCQTLALWQKHIVMAELSTTVGATGMAKGLLLESQCKPVLDNWQSIAKLKTAGLFRLCIVLPAMLEQDDDTNLSRLCSIADNFGVLYQLFDDFNDIAEDQSQNGFNFFSQFGMVKARELSEKLVASIDQLCQHAEEDWCQLQRVIKVMSENLVVVL